MMTPEQNFSSAESGPEPAVRFGTGGESPGAGALPEFLTNPRDGALLRLVPAGTFIMGSTRRDIEIAAAMDVWGHPTLLLHETPQFRAWLSDFYISVYAVTTVQFAAFLSAVRPSAETLNTWAPVLEGIRAPTSPDGPFMVRPGFERRPAVHISWYGARAYCRWAGLRLPSEPEWEKAARGTDGRVFPWGNPWRADALRWYGGDRREDETTAPVDAYPEGRSPYGVFQMAGNINEWCEDRFQWDVYRRYAAGDPRPPRKGRTRVVRGGACLHRRRHHFRCAHRRGNPAAVVNILYIGIRCACDARPPSPEKERAPKA